MDKYELRRIAKRLFELNGIEHSYGDYTRYDTEKFQEFNKILEDFVELIISAVRKEVEGD